jgi:murein hydrolase activator
MIRFRLRKNSPFRPALLLIASLCLFGPLQAQKETKNSNKDQLVSKQKKIKEEIREISQILDVTKANKKNSIGRLVNINMKLEKRQELIQNINLQIAQINRDIKSNETQIAALIASLEKLKKEYARMVIFAQRNQDAYSVLMFIFAAESFSQAYSRLKYIQQYSEFRKKQALEIIETQTRLIARLNDLKEQKREKNSLLGIEEEEKKLLSSEKDEQEQVLTELQKKEKELKAELEKKKQETIQLQAEIRRQIELDMKRKAEEAEAARQLALKKEKEEREEQQRKLAEAKKKPGVPVAKVPEKTAPEKPLPEPAEYSEAAVALSADFINNRGKLPWPINKGIICEPYGEHEHPAIKGFMVINNGLEICSSKGAQARAVFAGEVTSTVISPTGGKLVIIRHGEYLSVYCNLEHVLVKKGDHVSVKQTIGTVMYDDEEGKSSMNFQIWKGQKTMDPAGWLLNAR